MATISHDPRAMGRVAWFEVRDVWTSLAITAIWVAVAVSAIWGPDIKTVDAAGAGVTLPSAVGVAFFALFATMAVARYGFGRAPKVD